MDCDVFARATQSLTEVAMSCDEGEGHKPDATKHCGLCTSCIFRRIALFHALGASKALDADNAKRYRDVPTRAHTGYELEAFELHGIDLQNACRSFEGLLRLDPDLSYALPFQRQKGLSDVDTKQKICDLYSRYAAEIHAFMSSAKPRIHERPIMNLPRGNQWSLLSN